MKIPTRFAWASCTAWAAACLGATDPASSQSAFHLQSFLADSVGVHASALDSLLSGQTLVHMLPSRSGREVGVFGAIPISATPGEFLGRFRSLAALSGSPGVIQVGPVQDPATLLDFRDLSLPQETVDALRTCRPGNCAVKLTADALKQVSVLQGSPASSFQAEADSLMEALLLEMAGVYLASGDSALPPYMDKGTPAAPGEGLSTLLASRTPLLDLFPGLPERLRRPEGVPSDSAAEDHLYWSVEEFGVRPVTGVSHMVIWPSTAQGLPAAIGMRRVYSTHYFLAGYSCVALVSDPTAGGTGGTFLLYETQFLFDADIPSLERGTLEGKLRSFVQGLLEAEQRVLGPAGA
jgi:hypothetical protein